MVTASLIAGLGRGHSPGCFFLVLGLAVSLTILLRQRKQLVGTTLLGAWDWVLLSILVLGAVGFLRVWNADSGRTPMTDALTFVAATSTLCPAVYVLGARRPHDGAWHMVVASLWAILTLPAWELLFLGKGEMLHIGFLRAAFIWLLIAVGVLNYLPTRFALSAILVAFGQVVLLLPQLVGATFVDYEMSVAGEVTLFCVALIAAWVRPTLSPFAERTERELDARWLSFRNKFGAMWGLRVMQQVNATAETSRWHLSLGWWGIEFHNYQTNWDNLPPQVFKDLQQTMDNLLRRFEALPSAVETKAQTPAAKRV